MVYLTLCHEKEKKKKKIEIWYIACTVHYSTDWLGPGVAYTVYTHQQYSAIKTQPPSEKIKPQMQKNL